MAEQVQYVIKRGITDGIDYNMDGVIDENDDIVVKMVNGKEVGRRLLNEPVREKVEKIIEKDVRQSMKMANPPETQRIVYERMPPANMANPPPVVIKDETTFGQHVKAGAGLGVGFAAVNLIGDVLGGLFSNNGGKSKKRITRRK